MTKKLQLDEVLAENIPEMLKARSDIHVAGEALGRYESDITQIDNNGGLTRRSLEDLITFNSGWHARLAAGSIQTALSKRVNLIGSNQSTNLFLSGASAVLLDGDGSVVGVHHNPNTGFEQLDAYGNQLKWSLKHAALAAIAMSTTRMMDGPESLMGYLGVENAIRVSKGLNTIGNITEIPFNQRHHLGGGAFYESSISPRGGLRKDPIGLVVCGVSGVLVNPVISESILLRPQDIDPATVDHLDTLHFMARQAASEDALDGFTGNLFAGSIDSAVARYVLTLPFGEGPAPIDLDHVIEEAAEGINVH